MARTSLRNILTTALCAQTFIALTGTGPAGGATGPSPDVRLTRPVTCQVIGTDLGRLARILTTQTGVRIRVANDIADERLNVFVTDYPLGRLQRNLATIFGYKWSVQPSSAGTPAYLFWRDAATRKRTETLRQRKSERIREIIPEDLAKLKRLVDMSDAEVGKLPASERAFAGHVRKEPIYRYLIALSTTETDVLVRGAGHSGLSLDVAAIPDGSPLMDVLAKRAGSAQLARDRFTNVGISLYPSDPTHTGQGVRMINLDSSGPSWSVDGGFPLTADAFEQRWSGAPDARILREYLPQFSGSASKDALTGPRLRKPVKPIEPFQNTYGEGIMYQDTSVDVNSALFRIGLSSGVPIVSDYYAGSGSVDLKGLTCAQAVPLVGEKCDLQWMWTDSALLFRHNDWPNLMLSQIPLRVLDTLDSLEAGPLPLDARCFDLRKPPAAASLDRQRRSHAWNGPRHYLNFSQSLIAAALADAQIGSLYLYGYWRSWEQGRQSITMLRFLSTLTPEQREQAWTERGLDPNSLGPASREAFSAFYEVRWTRIGLAPRVDGLRLTEDRDRFQLVTVRMPIVFPDKEIVLPWGDVVHPNESKESQVALEFAPEKEPSGRQSNTR